MRCLRNQKGSVTLESTVSFTAFLFLFIILLSLMNFARAQSTMSTAVNEVAKEISQYSYVYSVTGLQEASNKLDDAAKEHKTEYNELIKTFNGITKQISEVFPDNSEEIPDDFEGVFDNISGDVETLKAQLETIVSNPQGMMMAVATILGSKATDEIKSALAVALAENMSHKYINTDKNSASLKLKRLGIENGLDDLNFGMSQIFHSGAPEDIVISVYYEVKMFSFFGLDLKANFVQTAHTRAWLNGDVTPLTKKLVKDRNTDDEPEEDDPQEDQWSIWEMTPLNRGKYIVQSEIKYEASQKDISRTYATGVDAYDAEKNEMISYTSIDTFSKSYSEDKALEARIKKQVNDLIRSGEKLEKVTTYSTKTADGKEVLEMGKDKNYRVQIVFPDGTDESRINALLDKVRTDYPSSVKIDYHIGYGKSPNQGKEGG